jgi:hypothetical protein
LALLCAALLAFVFLREPGPDAAARPAARATGPRAPRAPGPVTTTPSAPARNVFEYAAPDTAPAPLAIKAPPVTFAPVEVERAPIVASAAPVRLVGLVHRGGTLRAALAISGEVVILGTGETAEGYQVLSIDTEAGVRLRGPDGAELALVPPDKR